MSRKSIYTLLISSVIILTAFIIYWPATSFHFFQDDFGWLSFAKQSEHSINSILNFRVSNFFMPAVNIYFIITQKIFGNNDATYHGLNIFFHALNAILLYFFLKKIGQSKISPILGTSVFLCLRFIVEATVWVSAITILLTTTLMLTALLLWIKHNETQKNIYYFSFIATTVILMLTKEWSVLLIPFIIITQLIFDSNQNRHTAIKPLLKKLAIPLILFGAYLIIEYFTQTKGILVSNGNYSIGAHVGYILLNNFLLLAVPLTNIGYTHQVLWTSLSIIYAVCIGLVGYVLYKRHKNGFLLGATWIFIALLPTSFFTHGSFVSRYSYLPAIGLSICCVKLIDYLTTRFKHKIVTQIITLAVFAYCIINAYFIRVTLDAFYRPIYQENRYFSQALLNIDSQLNKNDTLYIYDNTPHKKIVLKHVLSVINNIPNQNVKILEINEKCPQENRCLLWDKNNKTIKIL